MLRLFGKVMIAAGMVLVSIVIGAIFSYQSPSDDPSPSKAQVLQESSPTTAPTATETIPPYTPLPSVTPANTLRPAPTFEPPTMTPTPTIIPTNTPISTVSVNVSIPGLHGAETPTPSTTPGCETREDWQLTYTVQFDDTLSSIADLYGTWVDELAEGNCLTDKNLITVGQVLHVPGESQPNVPEVECVTWEPMTPFNGSMTVPADGTITFNWRGPAAPINLIRIIRPDGSKYEVVIELRQNETIKLNDYLSQAGTYTWYVYPLDRNFQQIQCLEGGPWTFTKPISSTATPTQSAMSGIQ